MAEWQPIDTAPRETYVLVCDARAEIWMAAYHPENKTAKWRGARSEVYYDLLYWMPLPAPPSPVPEKESR